jgi:proteasome lid subunit RPN8/RPN11
MSMLLEQSMLEAIAAIGDDRRPNEACGLLIPVPNEPVRVVELPNRSLTPHDEFEMKGEDIFLTLQSIFGNDVRKARVNDLIPSIAIWHTHPSGNVGPSRFDMRNKPARFQNLVVTLREGQPPLATWF